MFDPFDFEAHDGTALTERNTLRWKDKNGNLVEKRAEHLFECPWDQRCYLSKLRRIFMGRAFGQYFADFVEYSTHHYGTNHLIIGKTLTETLAGLGRMSEVKLSLCINQTKNFLWKPGCIQGVSEKLKENIHGFVVKNFMHERKDTILFVEALFQIHYAEEGSPIRSCAFTNDTHEAGTRSGDFSLHEHVRKVYQFVDKLREECPEMEESDDYIECVTLYLDFILFTVDASIHLIGETTDEKSSDNDEEDESEDDDCVLNLGEDGTMKMNSKEFLEYSKDMDMNKFLKIQAAMAKQKLRDEDKGGFEGGYTEIAHKFGFLMGYPLRTELPSPFYGNVCFPTRNQAVIAKYLQAQKLLSSNPKEAFTIAAQAVLESTTNPPTLMEPFGGSWMGSGEDPFCAFFDNNRDEDWYEVCRFEYTIKHSMIHAIERVWDRAVEDLEYADGLNHPDWYDETWQSMLLQRKAIMCGMGGRPKDGLQAIEQALSLKPSHKFYFWTSLFYHILGKHALHASALEFYLENANEREEMYPRGCYMMCDLERCKSHLGVAREWYRKGEMSEKEFNSCSYGHALKNSVLENLERAEKQQRLKMKCKVCGAKNEQMKQCGRCKKVTYCGQQCQKTHWKVHKKECKK